jgi:uncharacterized protein YjbJ (UPF0337 family)
MNREQLEGNWKQLKGHVQEKWMTQQAERP